MKITDVWRVLLRNLTERYKHFGGLYYFHLQSMSLFNPENGGKYVP
jgi:hypothetical protein